MKKYFYKKAWENKIVLLKVIQNYKKILHIKIIIFNRKFLHLI
jgi:hypothetical protein